ncbi:MAG: hypothetical protein AAFW66_01045, partial [Pseudomonadota bacterium]
PRDRIVSVGAIMDPGKKNGKGKDQGISPKEKIGEVAEQVLSSEKPVNVVDADSNVIGTVSRERITKALFGKDGVV